MTENPRLHSQNGDGPTVSRRAVITSSSSRAAPPTMTQEEISIEEQKALAGLEEDAALLPSEDLLGDLAAPQTAKPFAGPPQRNIANVPGARAGLALAAFGLAAFALSSLSSLFQGGNQATTTEQPEPEAEPVIEEATQSDQYKARLAVIDQRRDLIAAQQSLVPIQPEPEAEAEAPTPTPAPAPAPTPAPVVQRPAPAPQPPAPVSPPEPEIDPFDRWNRLAAVGAAGHTASLAAGIDLDAPRPTVAPEAQPTAPTASTLRKASIGAGDRLSLSAEPVLIASAAPFIPTQRRSSGMTKGAIGILTRQPVTKIQPPEASESRPSFSFAESPFSLAPPPTTYRIPLGAAAAAEVSVPVLWIPDGQSLTQGRSAVTLTEPLKTVNGHEALPEGTVFITEVTHVASGSLVVEQTAVALIYKGVDGQIYQEEITPGVIIIRGRANQPLIASRVIPGRNFGQDLLSASVSALANIGARVAEPDFVSTVSTSGGVSSSSAVVTRDGGDEVLGAALEGFFGSISDDLEARAELRQSLAAGQRPVLVVGEGAEVSVLVNGILEVTR